MRRFMIVSMLLLTACNQPARDAGAPSPRQATPASTGIATTPENDAATEAPRSLYTSIANHDCKMVDRDAETGDTRSLCPGVDGYQLLVLDGDARMSLDVLDASGRAHPLDLWSRVSTAFSSLGERVEWRYARAGQPPAAMIVRFDAQEDPDAPERKTSYLVVARLGGERPCVIAKIVPSTEQNQRARAAADGAADAACLPEPG